MEVDDSGAVTSYAATRASKLAYQGRTLLEAKRALHAAVRCDPVHGGLQIELELEAADRVTLFAVGDDRLPDPFEEWAASLNLRIMQLKPETDRLISMDLPAGKHVFGAME